MSQLLNHTYLQIRYLLLSLFPAVCERQLFLFSFPPELASSLRNWGVCKATLCSWSLGIVTVPLECSEQLTAGRCRHPCRSPRALTAFFLELYCKIYFQRLESNALNSLCGREDCDYVLRCYRKFYQNVSLNLITN